MISINIRLKAKYIGFTKFKRYSVRKIIKEIEIIT